MVPGLHPLRGQDLGDHRLQCQPRVRIKGATTMSTTTQIVLRDKDLEKINYFVNMAYFEDEKELIQSTLRKFLYELGLAEIRRRIPQEELSEEEVEAELEEIRRVEKEIRQFQIATRVHGGSS